MHIIRKTITLLVVIALLATAPSPLKKIETSKVANAAPITKNKIISPTIPPITPPVAETPVTEPKPFDANDRSTWPVCAENEIVRADNGQCATKAPEPLSVAEVKPKVASAPAPVSSNAAKAFIYSHESGNVPCKINGGAIDCGYTGSRACGIGQALPCGKLRAVCPDLSDYACQDVFFTGYMQNRYVTWENARAFWLAHEWW